jgi:hypothetical protein
MRGGGAYIFAIWYVLLLVPLIVALIMYISVQVVLLLYNTGGMTLFG